MRLSLGIKQSLDKTIEYLPVFIVLGLISAKSEFIAAE